MKKNVYHVCVRAPNFPVNRAINLYPLCFVKTKNIIGICENHKYRHPEVV